MNKLYTTALLTAFMATHSLFAQESPRLLLNSGTYELQPSAISEALTLNEAEGLTAIRIVQFERPLLQEERELAESKLGEILGYLPENAYIMILKSDVRLEDFEGLPLYGVARLSPEMKMTHRLYHMDIPDYAWRGDRRIEVVAGLDKYANAEVISQNLIAAGFTVVEYNVQQRTITLEIDVDNRTVLAAHPHILFIQPGEAPAEPENFNAIRSARSTTIKNRFAGGRHYDGSGVVVGHGDDGDIGPHIDYTGRIIARNTNASGGDHGDHVAGTIFGAGNINPLAEGMAPGADLYYYRYPRNLNNVDADYQSDAVRITNSSYSNGCNAGYTAFTQQVDEDGLQNPKLLHVFSAGNDGASNCGYGAGAGWGNITGGHKIGKNVIATANVTAADQIAGSSSRGPAADGRLKPDVASVGTSVYSTIDPNTYGYKTGTSMAAPGVAGAAAQLFQAFVENQGSEPDGGLLKAFMMNTADDLGNAGPDFIYGYGRINNLRAVRDIEDGNYITDSVTTSQRDSFLVSVPPNTAELRVMVYWTDPAGSINSARPLVNDLNATVVTSNGTVYQPWVLDPTPQVANLNAPAVRATDSLNNTEQITIDNPSAGDVYVKVEGTNVPLGPQKYYIVYSFVPDAVELTYPFGGEPIIAGTQTEIYWDASPGTSSFTIEFSDDNGSSWSALTTAGANARRATWNVPSNLATDQALVRISRGTQTDVVNSPLVVVGRPNQIGVVQACPDSFTVRWQPVIGANEYEIYTLGNKYMDSIGRTTDTFYVFRGYSPNNEIWYSVSAVPTVGGKAGQRAIAKTKATGLQNCAIYRDLAAFEISSPQPGNIQSCHDLSAMPIIIELSNAGLSTLDTLPIAYSVNSTLYRDTLFTTLNTSGSTQMTLSTTINGNVGGSFDVKVWSELSNDGNRYNDTAEVNFTVVTSGSAKAIPFVETFDSWTNCGIATDCGATVCSLFNDFENLTNGVIDDIDWRTNNGSTSSSGTGPSNDHTQGNSLGKYLYLEASGSCNFKEAVLMSPCIDLTAANQPELSFWYHMNGADIGELHVDIFSEGIWYLDVITPLTGPQGNAWMQVSTSLIPWAGKVVSVRFRGSTGGDYQGDLAIDDLSVIESNVAPTADFIADKNTPCLGETVRLEDKSVNVASSWNWSITPSTFNFVNGTTANSQNPEVQFTALGNYDIKLVASNSVGSDSITKAGFITLNNGLTLPFIEDFQNGFVPTGWELDNPDNLLTWEGQSCLGPDGTATIAARVNNFSYNASGQLDALVSSSFDLISLGNPAVVFDISYSGHTNNSNDRLRMEVSTDCGQTWNATGYDYTGSDLRTTATTSSNYIPTSAAAWRQDTVDLTSYAGQSVKIRFVNITDGGNNLYLDNIQLYDLSVAAPSAGFVSDLQDSCLSRTLTFTYTGNATDVEWDFGSGATPTIASGVGPHAVLYSFSGSKRVQMDATNLGGSTHTDLYFILGNPPIARFNYAVDVTDSMTYNFTNTSLGTITNYTWDFDDNGATSTSTNAQHTFSTGGDHDVMLIAENRCGPDTVITTIAGISVPENAPASWVLAPVPASDFITLMNTDGNLEIQSSAIYNMQGQLLSEVSSESTLQSITFNTSQLPVGVYFLRVQSNGEVITYRFVVGR
ncbi:MAG: PKD domain-containing protein [Bacteroidetes bacterium]|nr:MAG: PKD domain-containing protein [Bacteroidota bacterium]